MDVDTKTQPQDDQAAVVEDGDKKWKVGDRLYANWVGNGCFYPATVCELHKDGLLIAWDDADETGRRVTWDQIMEATEDTSAWSMERIDKRASVRNTKDKGRCLFTNEACEPG